MNNYDLPKPEETRCGSLSTQKKTPAEPQQQLARPLDQELANHNSLPASIGPDPEIDDALVEPNYMCFSAPGGGGGGSMWYIYPPLHRKLEGPALVRYLARNPGKAQPYCCSTSGPFYVYNRATGYFDEPPQPPPSKREPSTFWNGLKAFLGISSRP